MKKSLSDYLKERYSAGTAWHYEREIRNYLGLVPSADQSNYRDLVHYLGQLRERYKNAGTLNRIRCCLKAYYDYLLATGHRNDNPAEGLYLKDQVNRDIQLQDLFSEAELTSLLNREERFKGLGYRNGVVLSLLVYQGLRTGELQELRVEDIDLRSARVYVRKSRKGNSRTLNLRPTQILLFQDYMRERGGEGQDYLLIGSSGKRMSESVVAQLLKAYKEVYAPRKVTATTIRQSVITNLLRSGKDLRVVQVFAGHKYPSTTEMYKPSGEGELQTAIERLHPMG